MEAIMGLYIKSLMYLIYVWAFVMEAVINSSFACDLDDTADFWSRLINWCVGTPANINFI